MGVMSCFGGGLLTLSAFLVYLSYWWILFVFNKTGSCMLSGDLMGHHKHRNQKLFLSAIIYRPVSKIIDYCILVAL